MQSIYDLILFVCAGGAERHAGAVQSTLDGALGAALIILLPCISYVATHAPTMPSWHHLWSLLLLSCPPCLYLLCTKVQYQYLPLLTGQEFMVCVFRSKPHPTLPTRGLAE